MYIAAVSGGTTVYSTQFNLSTCSSSYGTYNCVTSLPVGMYQIYAGLLDSGGTALSTNFYTNVPNSTIYPNGSPYGNYVHVSAYGIWNRMFFEAPTGCFPAVAQQVPVLILDADNYAINGPLANPVTISATTVNGAGTGAINLYATYGMSAISLNGVTIYDTSVYQNPYVNITGAEGAVNVSVSTMNIPAYMPAMNSYTFGYASTGPVYAAAGKYLGWGIDVYGYLNAIAIESTYNQAIACGNASTSYGLASAGTVGAILDPVSGNPFLVVTDAVTNTVQILDGELTSASHFALNQYPGYPSMRPQAALRTTATFHPANQIYSVFQSNVITGRVDIISGNSPYGTIDLLDTSGGTISATHTIPMQIATANTRLAGVPSLGELYYANFGSSTVYAAYTATGAPVGTVNLSGSLSGGEIFALQPSGAANTNIFIRGAYPAGPYPTSFYLCAFDANASSTLYCHQTGSPNQNSASIHYSSGTGNLMFLGGSSLYAVNAQLSAYNAINSFPGSSLYNFAAPALRFTPGAAIPNALGIFSNANSTNTMLNWNGSSWAYVAAIGWPNPVALTYPY